ncbi:MAG TPA: hypothetical protein DD670_18850 [Planctomycetaceae bacterium]|nr:hypothetical protein [Planctomycetaceae bacterium]
MEWYMPFLMALAGLFLIVAAALDWDFFFEMRKARTLVAWFGRGRARVFYIVLGSFLLLLGFGFTFGVIATEARSRQVAAPMERHAGASKSGRNEPEPSGKGVTLWDARVRYGDRGAGLIFACNYRWDQGKPSMGTKYLLVIEALGDEFETGFTAHELQERGMVQGELRTRHTGALPDCKMYLVVEDHAGGNRREISNVASYENPAAKQIAAAQSAKPAAADFSFFFGSKSPEPQNSTPSSNVLDGAIARLKSSDVDERNAAVRQIVDVPVDEARRREVAALLESLLKDKDDLVRDAAMEALMVWGDPSSVPAVIVVASDESPWVRHKAVQFLGKTKSVEAAEALASRLKEHHGETYSGLRDMGSVAEPAILKQLASDDANTRHLALKLLAEIGTEQCVPALIEAIEHADVTTRRLAFEAICQRKDARCAEAVARRLTIEDDFRHAADALRAIGSPAEMAVAAHIADEDEEVRHMALDILRHVGTQESVPALNETLKSPDRATRHIALSILRERKDARSVVPVTRLLLSDEDRGVATDCLIQIGPAVEDTILKGLKHANPAVVASCCNILGKVGTKKSVNALQGLVNSRDGGVAANAKWALDDIMRREAGG